MSHPIRRPTFVGLPSNPSPRSRSLTAGGTKQDLPPVPPRPSSAASHRHPLPSSYSTSPPPPLPHTLRTQQSLVNLSSSNYTSNNILPPVPPVPAKERKRIARVPPPSLPPLPPFPTDDDALADYLGSSRKESISSLSSASSNASSASASSLFSAGSLGSATSSTTTLADEELAKSPKEGQSPTGLNTKVAEGFGSSLWNRVANVAGSLSISVSKAWEANVATYTGEVTPPGQESRLTRALKSYHIAKARAPSDLPEWLFEEKERKVPGRLRVMNPSPEDRLPEPPIVLPTPPIPVPAVPPSSQSNSKPSRANSTRSSQASPSPNNETLAPSQPMTRVAQRLQQMREGNTPSTSSTGRVRFKEQIHPRRMASTPNLGEAAKHGGDHDAVPDMPTGFVKPISSPARTSDGRSGQAAVIVGLGNKVTSNDFPAAQFPAASRLKGPGLAKVDIRGRRPAANGLPTGVRPVRI